MSDRWRVICPKCKQPIVWVGSISEQPPCQNCKRQQEQQQRQTARRTTITTPPEPTADADEAMELCDEILDLIDELPDRAQDFAESVGEKVRSIRETVEQRGMATDGQLTALENMKAGVERWFR